jgi:hypothetical protein
MKLVSILLFFVSISHFSDFKQENENSFLPILLNVYQNGVEIDKKESIDIENIFKSKKLKLITTDDLNRLLQDQYKVGLKEIAESNGRLTMADISDRISSQKPFATKVHCYLYGKDLNYPDSVKLTFASIPPKGKHLEVAFFVNSDKSLNTDFLRNCIDSCMLQKYFL